MIHTPIRIKKITYMLPNFGDASSHIPPNVIFIFFFWLIRFMRQWACAFMQDRPGMSVDKNGELT